ncbi:MAG: glycoside hydrolase family 1 protein [Reyranella sp.]|nr:glycoside hydrolase family 1 protein [Reyranella sp.]
MIIGRREMMGATAVGAALAATGPVLAKSMSPETGFLWGVATAAHVSEGQNINSDYWVLENIPGTYFREPSGDTNDSWHRWREDLALVKAAGLNSYRFSIEWARIEPEPGQFSAATLAHYRAICVACREAGIEPVVTFHHFTSPRWIAAMGGWENPETADRFARYCEVAAKALGDSFGWACTINEPNAQVTSYVIANGKEWKEQPAIRAAAAKAVGSDRFHAFFMGDSFKVRDICLVAHAKGRDAIKAAAPHAKVGIALALQELIAGPGGEAFYRRLYNEARAPFYEAVRGDDYIGVQTYNRSRVGPDGYLPPVADDLLDMSKYPAPPEALAASVREAYRATGVPVMVSEHGINTLDDNLRIRHTRASLEHLGKVIDDGLPVLGYFHFTLNDTWEWSAGHVPRFGMVEVDRATFERRPRPSLAAYRALIADTRKRHRWA